MSALPFRGPSKTNPGERVVVHTQDKGDIKGEVMWCQPNGSGWDVFVLEDGRRAIWQSPVSDIERVSEGDANRGETTSGTSESNSRDHTPSSGTQPVPVSRVIGHDGDQERMVGASSANPPKESPGANDGSEGRVETGAVVGKPGITVPYGTALGPGAEVAS